MNFIHFQTINGSGKNTITNRNLFVFSAKNVDQGMVGTYSHLFNKRGGWNKRGGGAKVAKSLNVEAGINVEGGFFGKNQYINLKNVEWRVEKSKKSINVQGGFLICVSRVEFFKIGKRDVTFFREMRVPPMYIIIFGIF